MGNDRETVFVNQDVATDEPALWGRTITTTTDDGGVILRRTFVEPLAAAPLEGGPTDG